MKVSISNPRSIIITIIVMAVIGSLLAMALPTPTLSAGPTNAPEVWVNPVWNASECGGHNWGEDAFATIGEGVYNVASGGIVNVYPGVYNGGVTIDKPLVLNGANVGKSGSDLTRTDESIINGSGGIGIAVNTNDVIVDGFSVTGFPEPINVTGDSANIANNVINADTTDYLISVQGNQSSISNNALYANQVNNAAITVTGDQAMVTKNDLEIGRVGTGDYSTTGYGVQVVGNNARVTSNTLNVSRSGNDIINVYGDKGVISGNTVNSAYVWDYTIEYNQNNHDDMILATSNDGTIANNVLNIDMACYPLIENNGNNTVIQGNALNVNIVRDPGYFYYMIDSYGSGTQIVSNTIGNESTIAAGAIYSSGWDISAKNTQIVGNTIHTSYMDYSAIYVEGVSSTITDNTIDSAGIGAVSLAATASTKPSHADKKVNALSISGYGIEAYGSDSTVTNNVIKNASEGIYVMGDYATVTGNRIDFNGPMILSSSDVQELSLDVPDFVKPYAADYEAKLADYNAMDLIGWGITVANGLDSVITGNVINNNNGLAQIGISQIGDFPTIEDNYVSNALIGIYDSGYGASICGNTLNNTGMDLGITSAGYDAMSLSGMNIYHAGTSSKIDGNVILNNKTAYSYYGILCPMGSAIEVKDNVIDNTYNGIYFQQKMETVDVVVENNTVSNANDMNAQVGVLVSATSGVTVKNNRLTNMNGTFMYGIYLYGDNDIMVEDNVIENVTAFGIYQDECAGLNDVIANNTITRKDIYGGYGICQDLHIGSTSITGNRILSYGDGQWSIGIIQLESSYSVVKDNTILNASAGILTMTEPEVYNTQNSVYEGNVIVSYVNATDHYVMGGIYLFGVMNATVKDNTVESNDGWMEFGVISFENNKGDIIGNSISNTWMGIITMNLYRPSGYGMNVEGNSIVNDIGSGYTGDDANASGWAIVALRGNAGTVNNNTIGSSVGYWRLGILCNGYETMIDSNSITNASRAIIYLNPTLKVKEYGEYDTYMTGTMAKMDKLTAPFNGEVVSTAMASDVEVTSALPASEYATIQNNVIDDSAMKVPNVGILYIGLTGAVSDNKILLGDNNTTFGIRAYCDNLLIKGNEISGAAMADASVTPVSGAALCVQPVFEADPTMNPFKTTYGTAYIVDNGLTNNRVQMILYNWTAFKVDDAGTVASLDKDTLNKTLGNNMLDKAVYVMYANGTLKTEAVEFPRGTTDSEYVIVRSSVLDANAVADTEAGDQVIEYTFTYNYDLVSGWNLISVPLNVPNNDIEGFFPVGVLDDVVVVWGWDEAAQDWVLYAPDPNEPFYGPPYNYPHLTTLEAGRAYWVYMDGEASFQVEGAVPNGAPAGVPLVSGWNFVGITGLSSQGVVDMYPGAVVVWGWDEVAQNWVLYAPDPNEPFYGPPYNYPHLTDVLPGHGYWVYMEGV